MSKAAWLTVIASVSLLAGCGKEEPAAVAEGPENPQAPEAPEAPEAIGPDQLGFSLTNMDTSVDPADDFTQYATGGWQARVERPADMGQLAFMTILMKRIDQQLQGVVEKAAAEADTARKGSPLQQIGALYNAYMDVDAINAAGITPIQPELDRIAAISSSEELAAYLGHYAMITGQWPLLQVEVFEGITDAKNHYAYIEPAEPALEVNAILEGAEDSAPKQLYRKYVTDLMMLAGYSEDDATQIGASSLAIESSLHAGKSDPVLMVDYRNWNNPRTIEQLQAEMPNFPLDAFFKPLGLESTGTLLLPHVDYPKALSAALDEYSLDQFKDYLSFRLVQRFAGLLPTDFENPGHELNSAFMGTEAPVPPREKTVMDLLKASLPQPLGKIYVDNFFAKDTQDKGLDMVRRIQAAFRSRIAANDWISESTRNEALEKVDGFYYRFGLPDRWIDYSSVEIGDNLVEASMNASRFWVEREMGKVGKPVERWAFSDPAHTSPTSVNAAYNPSANGFEVTASIAQPPSFNTDMDAPIYFCRLGAVIGHEMTHGFDSGGRLFDYTGNLRNWWTDADEAHFDDEAAKLVAQGNAYEPLPGVFMNGGLTVKENLADIGGISFAHDALMTYLEENPDENIEVDGLTPSQRCFISWAQLWAEKVSDQIIPIQLQDNHAPGNYRTYAPLQHLDVFYDAFGIKEGDPMWLPPEQRIDVW